MIADFVPTCEFGISPRGKSGIFAVKFVDADPARAKIAARNFINFLTVVGVVDGVWAKFDEPQQLRLASTHARKFAHELKLSFDDGPFYQLVEGHLVFGSVLVGPVTRIPGEADWPSVHAKIVEILDDPSHVPFSFNRPPHVQLRFKLFSNIVQKSRSTNFVDSENDVQMDSSLNDPSKQ